MKLSNFLFETRAIYNHLFDLTRNPRERVVLWAQKMMKHLIDFSGMFFILAQKAMMDKRGKEGLYELINSAEVNLRPVIAEMSQQLTRN
jgi:hypothetical protein